MGFASTSGWLFYKTMRVSVTSNTGDVIAELGSMRQKVNFATVVALTQTAGDIKAALRQDMQSAFDRPTPYTLNSLRVNPATKQHPRADVWIKDDATKWLLPQVQGGKRNLKRFEKALQARMLMPKGWYAVPAGGAKYDAYGNISKGVIMKLLSALKAAEITAGYSANRTAASAKRRKGKQEQYFSLVKPHGKLKPGLYQRIGFAHGSAVKPVLLYVSSVTYRQRFDFYGKANTIANQRFKVNYEAAVGKWGR